MKLILDTNIVLDWLVFRDASISGLQPALDRGRVEIVTHQPAVDELRRVLTYTQLKLAIEQQQEVLTRYNSQTRLVTLPAGLHRDNLGLPPDFPRCRDSDDQHFLALAYHERSAILVSKDTALLELSKRAQRFGITVLDAQRLKNSLSDIPA